MFRRRVSATTRWMAVVALLGLTSAAASFWRPASDAPRVAQTAVRLVPELFTESSAQIVTTNCYGTPKQNDPDLGNQNGVLAIAMNSISLVDSGPDNALNTGDDVVVNVLSTPTDLNFASTTGTDVGNFVEGASVAAGSYEAIRVVMDNVFRIKCAVKVPPPTPQPGCAAPAGTYVTKGGPTITSPDSTSLPAAESSIAAFGSDQTLTTPLSSPLVVTPGGSVEKSIGFNASGACQLWNLGGGNYKIMPVGLSFSIH
jgi:hypothetical protein